MEKARGAVIRNKPLIEDLARRIEKARLRASRLSRTVQNLPESEQSSLDASLAELQTALEELQVTQEILKSQSDELGTAYEMGERERQRYLELFEFAPVGYLVTDREGRILEANRAAISLLSAHPSHIQGKSLLRYFREEDRKGIADLMSGWGESNRTRELETGVCPPLRDSFHGALSVAPIRGEESGIIGFRWMLIDITRRKQAEDEVRSLNQNLEEKVARRTIELQEANRGKEELLVREKAAREEADRANHAKDQFLAIVSHELRTPLTSILGWARVLKAGKFDPPTSQHGLDVIERNSRALTRIIDDLLDVSRIISGKLRVEKHPLDLRQVVEAAVEDVHMTAEAREISVRTSIPETALMVEGDAARLQQVVSNLISNAIKFTPRGGSINITVERSEDRESGHAGARISVSDTGQGIDPSFLPHVFDRFRQADSSYTREKGGLGLGLAIVHHLVDVHGGTVSASSPGPGKGATFTVVLPLIEEAGAGHTKEDGQPEPAEGEYGRLQGMRVLLVEDDEDTREYLRAALIQEGADVSTAASSAEAIRIISQYRPAVLVTDIGMPDEDGYGLIDRVRSLESTGSLNFPVIAVTAFAGEEDRKKALSHGFQAHLRKPVEPPLLVDTILQLVNGGRWNTASVSDGGDGS